MKAKPSVNDLEEFDPHNWPFFWVSQMVGLYLRELEVSLKRIGLDVSRYRVLMCVGHRSLSISEIADLAIVKMPTMMKIIQRMELEGLVSSRARESDGRFTDVTLTGRGLELRLRAWASADRLYRKSFAGVPERDEKSLNRIVRKIFEQLA